MLHPHHLEQGRRHAGGIGEIATELGTFAQLLAGMVAAIALGAAVLGAMGPPDDDQR